MIRLWQTPIRLLPREVVILLGPPGAVRWTRRPMPHEAWTVSTGMLPWCPWPKRERRLP